MLVELDNAQSLSSIVNDRQPNLNFLTALYTLANPIKMIKSIVV